jgi:hypothetical protein
MLITPVTPAKFFRLCQRLTQFGRCQLIPPRVIASNRIARRRKRAPHEHQAAGCRNAACTLRQTSESRVKDRQPSSALRCSAVQRVAAQLPELRRVPTIAAKQRLRQSNHARLFRDQRHVAVVTRNVDHVRLSRSNRAQLTLEIRVALRVRLLADDAPAELCETEFEIVSQTAAVGELKSKRIAAFCALSVFAAKLAITSP